MFCDATCPKCRKRVSWVGSVAARPPCPGCGHLPDMSEDSKEIEGFREYLRKRKELLDGDEDDSHLPGGGTAH